MPDVEELSERALRHRAEQLATLTQHESFRALQAEAVKKEKRMLDSIMQRLMSGESLESLARQIDLDRGFINGMCYLTQAVPAGAARKLREADSRIENTEPEVDFWSYGEDES